MFNRRRHGLGAVTEPSSEPWVQKATKSGDTLASLAAAYGTTPQEIVRQNGVAFNSTAINAWVMRAGGVMLSTGWAVLTDRSAILLPPHDRKDGEPPANLTVTEAATASGSPLSREEAKQRAIAAAKEKAKAKALAASAGRGGSAPPSNKALLGIALAGAAAVGFVMFKKKKASA